MGQVRVNQSRKEESREAESHAPVVWKQASTLEAPPSREGMRQRWVATSILGEDVTHHVMKKNREGWIPRPANTVPDSFPVPTMNHGQFKGCIGVEGLVLCEMTEEMALSREAYFAGKTGEQERFIESNLSSGGNTAGMEMSQRVTRGTKVGSGRSPQED